MWCFAGCRVGLGELRFSGLGVFASAVLETCSHSSLGPACVPYV